MLIVFFICDKLVPILRNGCGIWGKHYVTLFQENEMSAGLQSRNSKLDLEFFFALSIQWKSSLYCFCVGVKQEN